MSCKKATSQIFVLTVLLFIHSFIMLGQAVTPAESYGGVAAEDGLFANSKASVSRAQTAQAPGRLGGPNLVQPLPPCAHKDCDWENPEDQPFAGVSSAECALQVECTGKVLTNAANGGHAAKKIRIPVRAAQGPQGPRGPKGPQGPRGLPGHSPMISDATIARRRRRHPEEDQLFADNRRIYHYFQSPETTTTTTSTPSSSFINSPDVAEIAETSTTTTTTTTTKTPDEEYSTGTGESELSGEVSWNLEAQNAFTDIKVLELPASLGFTDRLASLEGLMGACSIEISPPANGSFTSTITDSYSSSPPPLRRCASRDFLFPSVVSTSVGVVIDWDAIEGITADEIWDMFQRLLADETLFRPVRLSPMPASLRSSWRDADVVQKPRLVGRYSKRAGNAVTQRASLVLPTLFLLVSLIVT